MWSILIILVVLAIFLLWIYVRKKYAYFRDRNIPYDEPTFPLGCISQFANFTEHHKFCTKMYNNFKGRGVIGGYFTMTSPEIAVIDLDIIQDVLVNDFSNFPNHGNYYNEKRDPMSPHLYSLRGERWRIMRTKLSPVFSLRSTCAMFESVSEVGTNLVEYVDRFVSRGKCVNARDISMRYMWDAMGSSALGMDCRSMRDKDPVLMKIANRLFQPRKREMIAYMATFAYPAIADYIPWVVTPKYVQETFQTIIKEIVDYREENNVKRNDFIDLLMDIMNNGCLVDDESGEVIGNITKDELVSNLYISFFWGYHTCRVMLTFALYEIALNEDIQDRAREEIHRVLGDDGELNYERLEEMTYIQQIADETLRKYPPHGYLERVTLEDYRVRKGGHLIEKGTMITVPIMGLHNDPAIYQEPHRFDPDRMTKEKMEARHPASFLPFGGGPRFCIGYRQGYMQVKLAIVKLLLQYTITVNSRTKRTRGTRNFIVEYSIDEDIFLDAQRI